MVERMHTVSFKLPRKTNEALDDIARKRGITRSAVVREALDNLSSRSPTSVTARAGDLVGSLSGPADLSTNSKYMDDFGK